MAIDLKGWGRLAGEQVVVSATLDLATDNPTMEATVNAAGGAAVTVPSVLIRDLTVRYLDGTLVGTDATETVDAVVAAIQPAEVERLVTVNTPTSLDGTIRIYGWGVIGDPATDDSGDVPPAPADPGLVARYWNNQNWSGLEVVKQVEASPYMPRNEALPPGVNSGNFSARWTGEIEFPTTGGYRFRVNASDEGDLYIDNTLIVQITNDSQGTKDSITYQYTSGQKYTFWASVADGGLVDHKYLLYWQVPGSTVFVQVPDSAFTQATVTAPIEALVPDQGRYHVEYVNRYEDQP